MSVHPQEPLLEASDIQGNSLRGFDTNHLMLLGFKFTQPALARAWLATFANRLANLSQVHTYRLQRSASDPSTATQVLVNAALSHYGLKALGFDGSAVAETFFTVSMGSMASELGDPVVEGKPMDYVLGQDRQRTPDLLLLLGCQEIHALEQTAEAWMTEARAAELQLIYQAHGQMLPGEIEHFGYKDGISQPGPRGLLPGNPPQPLTPRLLGGGEPMAALQGKPGQPLVWPGQFVFGYATQTLEDPLRPGGEATGTRGEAWVRNGSLLVFRRLRQNVRAFREFLSQQAQELSQRTGQSITERQLGARIVGRWEDGTPVILNPDHPDETLSSDGMRINHFTYGGSAEVKVVGTDGSVRTIPGHPEDIIGLRCPHFAHVRKVNPRDQRTDQGSHHKTLAFQMLRRGIPYGPPYREGEGDQVDRGLLFLSYQTSIADQFQILNKLWMNNPSAPERDAEGHDLLVGQAPEGTPRFGSVRDSADKEIARVQTLSRWVIPTGGAFLFSPSLSFFRSLA